MSQRTLLAIAVGGALGLTTANAHAGRITLYGGPGFQGSSVATVDALPNVQRSELDGAATSVIVGNGTWEVLEPGNYPSLPGMTGIWSARQAWRARSSSRPISVDTAITP